MIKRSQPIFAVRDVKETIAFYEKILGFENPWFWGDPVGFGGIGWGEVHVMFNQQPDLAARIEGHQHHYWSDDLETLHARHLANAAPIIEPIENKPWYIREYTVRDPNGYHLRFSGPLKYEKPQSSRDTMPDYIRIDPRLPTPAEYFELDDPTQTDAMPAIIERLTRSIVGAVAIDTRTNQPVGRARAMEDARAWYSIWDVNVRPEYQSQRIGTAIIECVMAQLRQRGPAGAWVFLFTVKPEFYAQLGFAEQTCTMRRL